MITIHDSDKLTVLSYNNGLSYAITVYGDTPASLFFQGDDATELRKNYDAMELLHPDRLCSDLWLEVLFLGGM